MLVFLGGQTNRLIDHQAGSAEPAAALVRFVLVERGLPIHLPSNHTPTVDRRGGLSGRIWWAAALAQGQGVDITVEPLRALGI